MFRARRSQKWKTHKRYWILVKSLFFCSKITFLATFHFSCAWAIWCPLKTLPNTRGFAILGRPCAAAARKVKTSEVATLFSVKGKTQRASKIRFRHGNHPNRRCRSTLLEPMIFFRFWEPGITKKSLFHRFPDPFTKNHILMEITSSKNS